MRNMAVGQISLSGFNLNLPNNIKSDFSKSKTGRELRQNLCRGARAIAKQFAAVQYNVRIVKPVCEIIKSNLQNGRMAAQAAQVTEAVVVAEEAAVVAAADGVILSAEAEALLVTAEVVEVAEVGGAVGAGIGFGPAAAVIIIIIAICWYYASNHVSADKRKLLDEEFCKLLQGFKLPRK